MQLLSPLRGLILLRHPDLRADARSYVLSSLRDLGSQGVRDKESPLTR